MSTYRYAQHTLIIIWTCDGVGGGGGGGDPYNIKFTLSNGWIFFFHLLLSNLPH